MPTVPKKLLRKIKSRPKKGRDPKVMQFFSMPLQEQIAFLLDMYTFGQIIEAELRAGLYMLLNLEEHIALKCGAGFNGLDRWALNNLIKRS